MFYSRINRKSIFIALIFLAGSFCYGLDVFKVTKPEIEIKSSFSVPVKASLKNEKSCFSNIVTCDMSSIDFNIGYAVNDLHSDTVVEFNIAPMSFSWFEFGFGANYHFYDYFEFFGEQDFALTTYVSFYYKDRFRFDLSGGPFIKSTYFKGVDIDEDLFTLSLFLKLHFFWKIDNHLSFYFDLKSADYYDYQFFGTPFYTFGTTLDIDKHLGFGIDFTTKLIDMFAVVANATERLLNFYVKVSF